MPRKGMKSLLFSPRSPFHSSESESSSGSSPSPSIRPSFSESVMDRTLELSEPLIMKWDPDTTTFAKVTSLFYENRREARDFIKYANNLQRAMHLMVTESPSSPKLVRAQSLMQIAMKRLQKEFYQILAMNRAHLDPESLSTRSSTTSVRSSISDFDDDDEDDEGVAAGQSISEVEDASTLAMADLRAIAECMISNGYAKECVKIYKIIRKSIIDEGIYKLGVERLTPSHVRKMDWGAMEVRINSWLSAVSTAVNTLFNGEKVLSDNVFASSESIRESCFADISRDGAMILFGFPENVAKNSKKSPEKVFRLLDMYTAITNYWPVIDFTFSAPSTAAVKSQAITSLVKIGEYVRSAVTEFELEIQKNHSKSTVSGGGHHPLTTDTMDYLSLLADYSNILSDILATTTSPDQSESDASGSSGHGSLWIFSRLIHTLLVKIAGKAKLYKDASISNLFLANNYRYVVVKVRSSNLKYLMGDEWLSNQDEKVKQFATNYENAAWAAVAESLPMDPTASLSAERVKEHFKRFNASFEHAQRKQSAAAIPDSELRDDVRASIARRILPAYEEFFRKHSGAAKGSERNAVVRFRPEDVRRHLSDLLFRTGAN